MLTGMQHIICYPSSMLFITSDHTITDHWCCIQLDNEVDGHETSLWLLLLWRHWDFSRVFTNLILIQITIILWAIFLRHACAAHAQKLKMINFIVISRKTKSVIISIINNKKKTFVKIFGRYLLVFLGSQIDLFIEDLPSPPPIIFNLTTPNSVPKNWIDTKL